MEAEAVARADLGDVQLCACSAGLKLTRFTLVFTVHVGFFKSKILLRRDPTSRKQAAEQVDTRPGYASQCHADKSWTTGSQLASVTGVCQLPCCNPLSTNAKMNTLPIMSTTLSQKILSITT